MEQSSQKLSMRFKMLWSTGFISACVVQVVMQYVQYYASDFLGVSVALFGTLVMLSKFFDAFTDAIGGVLIDRCNFKAGKGRPFDLALIGYWVCIILLFCTPVSMGTTARLIYVIVMYTLANAVFATLYNCANPIYLANSLDNKALSVSAVAFASVFGTLFSTIGGVLVPQMINTIGTTAGGWRTIAMGIGIPMILLGSLRFLFIKEKHNSGARASTGKISVKDMFSVVFRNKAVLIIATTSCLTSIGINLYVGVSSYYCKYIMNNFGLSSMISLTLLAIVFLVMFMPALSRKFGLMKILKICALVGAVGFVLRLVNVSSVPLLMISSLISVVGFYAYNPFVTTLLIDCMDYGEWKNGIRAEGSISAINSLAAKVGTAIGMGMTGVMLGLAHYDGTLAVQCASANTMIKVLFTWVPAVFCVIEYLLFRAYKIEGMMPEIRAELKARHGEED